MKKIISAVLAFVLLVGSGTAFTFSELNSFFEYTPPDTNPPDDGGEGGGGADNSPTLVVPTYKDYGRGTVDFDKVTYSRPDIDGAILSFNSVCSLVEKNEVSFNEQLEAIKDADDSYFEISTMFSYANIMTSKDSTDPKWSAEYEFISVNYPKFSQAVENLFVSCAQSVHAESFEEEYFGDGLIEEYSGGGSYSDALVALMEAEAELEAEYSKLNTATVTVSYEGEENTAQYFIDYYYEKYGKNSYTETTYIYHYSMINSLYYDAYTAIANPLYINLLKTRRLIADELGLESYTEHAYEVFGHDYSPTEMINLLDDIGEFVMPMFYKLYSDVFSSYAIPDGVRNIHHNDILNALYSVYQQMDEELFDVFSYMLQHGLYDIEKSSTSRFDGAFTVYLDTYSAPFIFVSTGGNISDYSTITHEFGHFFDNYVNYGASASLDLAEISSQALELLTLTKLDLKLEDALVKYLLVLQISEMLNTLRTQSLYAMFEHLAYELSYDELTEENLNAILAECEQKFAYPENTFKLENIVCVPHVVLYPEYVQAYCTSALVSLEIYFTEIGSEGAGLAAYKELLSRDENSSFEADLEATGLASPFGANFVKNISNKIYRLLCGRDFFKTNSSANAA